MITLYYFSWVCGSVGWLFSWSCLDSLMQVSWNLGQAEPFGPLLACDLSFSRSLDHFLTGQRQHSKRTNPNVLQHMCWCSVGWGQPCSQVQSHSKRDYTVAWIPAAVTHWEPLQNSLEYEQSAQRNSEFIPSCPGVACFCQCLMWSVWTNKLK